jgi:uroporphyrinogen III methyltransferase/synthase
VPKGRQAGERGPLTGRTVVVTRARAQVGTLAGQLRALGARVIEAPAIRIEPRAVELPPLADFDLLCLTSTNGVDLLFARLADQGLDARALAGLRVAAIGPGTGAALQAHGVSADVVPERSVAEGLLEALAPIPGLHRALVAHAADSRATLIDGLQERDIQVTEIALYDTVAERIDAATAASIAQADYVTFTSASTVRYLLDQAKLGDRARVVSIGPVTSDALREHGVEPDVEAQRHDIAGLIDALVGDAATPAKAPL